MIPRDGRPGLVGQAFLICVLSFCSTQLWAQRTQRIGAQRTQTRQSAAFAQDRIDISRAQPARRVVRTQNAQPKSPVRQAGFLDGACAECGPVCDCASCGVEAIEPTCGCGSIGECTCGVEYIEPTCGCPSMGECTCGVEVIEAGCGCELGGFCSCGVEAIPGCGLEVETPVCGIETIGPACGLEQDCGCDSYCGGTCSGGCLPSGIGVFLPHLKIDWCRFDLFAGVSGFTGPMNCVSLNANNPNDLSAAGGSFGFYQGFNEGRDLRRLLGWDIASQVGLRATQSHLSGSKITDDTRQQIFVTGGLFRRVDYGLQFGVVADYLSDDWYFQGDLVQVRSEISWNTAKGHIFGAEIMTGTGTDTSNTSLRDASGNIVSGTVQFEVLDQYRAFYRQILKCGGDWNVFLGGTAEQDVVFGARVNMPLYDSVVFNSGVTYLSPDDEGIANPHHDEAWNISLGFTYRPGGSRGCGPHCRPMFDVADNGTFIVRRR